MQIVDLGCGRGEWIELLHKNGYSNAAGVDTNRSMAAECRERGYPVKIADCVDYLGSLKKASLALITAFHVIEHLPFDRLMRLLAECHRTLKRGGRLILETPNPENLIVAAKNFYVDPTHRHPLPSLLTSFLVEHVGLRDVRTIDQHPFASTALLQDNSEVAARFNAFFYSAQDYAVIGTKR
jgi:O-antigen chain-terminating methyltransferase